MHADRSLLRRMKGAAFLEAGVFEEVARDEGATVQALAVVSLAAVAHSLGASRTEPGELGADLLAGLACWFLFAAAAFFLGTRLFGGEGSRVGFFRAVGLAQAPSVAFGLAVLPVVGWLVETGVVLWVLASSIAAVRYSLGIPVEQAVPTAVLAGALRALMALVL